MPQSPPQHFAIMAAVFEGSLVGVALVLGWFLGQPPLRTFRFDLRDAALSVAATLPPLGLFWLCLKMPWRPFRTIAQVVDDSVTPLFHECPLPQLLIIAALAGMGEEMLFRGVLQAAVTEEIGGPRGVWLGLLVAAFLFGLLHPMTPTYAALAGLIGLYLGWLWIVSVNLLTPILVHALYDFAALAYLVKVRNRHVV